MSLSTLNNDVNLLDTIDDKASGSLIKPSDWNTLVESVQGVGEALLEYVQNTDTRLEVLEQLVAPLTGRIDVLQAELGQLKSEIAPLLDQYVVTLRTEKVNYALGEMCKITAEVRDFAGNLVTSRPWIDFLTSWGQLRAAPGFTTSVSGNGSSISVRANSSGIAEVHVKAAHTENLTENQDLQVATIMESTLSTGQFFYQAIMDSPTPTSQPAIQAFSLMNNHYELAQSGPMQLFLDSYQLSPQTQILPELTPSIFSNWKHYRTVVVAFAKDDSNPTTPDAAKGTASIQVQFRDWVGPWINGYVQEFEPYIPGLVSSITNQVGNGSFAADLGLMQNTIEKDISVLGSVGRQRYYNAFIEAMDQATPLAPPVYMSDLRQTVKQAVTVQQIQEAPINALKGNMLSQAPALAAISGISGHAASAKAVAETTMGSMTALQSANSDLHSRVLALDSDLQASQQMSQAINNELSSISTNVLNINPLDQDSVKGQINLISAQIGKINETLNRG